MSEHQHDDRPALPAHCCPCSRHEQPPAEDVRRRGVLAGAVLGSVALAGLSWSALAAAEPDVPQAPPRRPLVVKPIFTYPLPAPPAADQLAQLGRHPDPAGRRGRGGADPRRDRTSSRPRPISRWSSCPWPRSARPTSWPRWTTSPRPTRCCSMRPATAAAT